MVFLPLKGRKGFFLLSVAISWMGAWHPSYFCPTELQRFLGGNGQFSPTKFQTTFFQQKNNAKTNWNILQPSKHPGAARLFEQQAATFFLCTGKHVFYGPGASCTGSSCWTQTKRLQASWGNAIKILWSHSPSLEMPVYTALQKGQLWNLKPASHVKKNTSASEVMANIEFSSFIFTNCQ